MKVLRTALLSTLLIICFGHVSYAQLELNNDGRDGCNHTILGVVGGSMEYIGDNKIRVIYDATAINRCGSAMGYTQVVYNGIVYYSQSFGNGTFHVNTVVELPLLIPIGGTDIQLECTACQGNSCHREGGAVHADSP